MSLYKLCIATFSNHHCIHRNCMTVTRSRHHYVYQLQMKSNIHQTSVVCAMYHYFCLFLSLSAEENIVKSFVCKYMGAWKTKFELYNILVLYPPPRLAFNGRQVRCQMCYWRMYNVVSVQFLVCVSCINRTDLIFHIIPH